jgi:hypothetical protein
VLAKADRLHCRRLPWHGSPNQDPLEPVAVQTRDEGLATTFETGNLPEPDGPTTEAQRTPSGDTEDR